MQKKSCFLCVPHRLDGQDRGDDVVRVVLPARHRHEPVPAAAHKDEAAGPEEPEEAGPHELCLPDDATVLRLGPERFLPFWCRGRKNINPPI